MVYTPPGSPEPHDDEPTGANGPGGARKALRIFGKTVKYGLIVLLVVIVGGAAAAGIYYWQVDIPSPAAIRAPQTATIVADDGDTVLAQMGANRKDVDLDKVPPHVRNAVLAAEDRDFYSNPGFSVSGFARAGLGHLTGDDDAGGGSTITQQYVKNALVGSNHTLWRKMKELVVSMKMTRNWSKDQILEAYLNTIYFGRGAYGIAAASEAYFGVPVEQLDVAQGAVLAASIRSPSLLDPATNPEGAKKRWNYVLDGMVDMGALDQSQRASLKYPDTIPPGQSQNDDEQLAGPNGLIKNHVMAELKDAGISQQEINTGGLTITTTIDPKVQSALVDAVHTKMKGEPDSLRSAAVSIDPDTGAVKGYYGGPDGTGYDFANAPLQTGSSFKVFGLAALLSEGKSLATRFDSSPLTVAGVHVTNVGGESCGRCTVAQALKMSLNTSFYRVEMSLDDGPKSVEKMAHKAGIPKHIPGVDGISLQRDDGSVSNGIILGEELVRPIDMASAYGTFANRGVHHDPYFVSKVVTSDGNVLLDRKPDDGRRAMSKAVADNVTAAMKPIAAYSGDPLAGGRPSAAKTGTAQLGDTGKNKDAWMVGFTPSLSTAVWVGNVPNSKPLVNYAGAPIYGAGLSGQIWKTAMDAALKGTDFESFPTPEPIGGVAGVPQWHPKTTTESSSTRSTTTTTAPPEPPVQEPTHRAPRMPRISQTEIMGVPVPIVVPGDKGRNDANGNGNTNGNATTEGNGNGNANGGNANGGNVNGGNVNGGNGNTGGNVNGNGNNGGNGGNGGAGAVGGFSRPAREPAGVGNR